VEANEIRKILENFYGENTKPRTTRTNLFQSQENITVGKDEHYNTFDIGELDPLKEELMNYDEDENLLKDIKLKIESSVMSSDDLTSSKLLKTKRRKFLNCPQPLCSFSTFSKKRIQIHYQHKHSNNPGECPLCGKMTTNMEKHHEMYHIEVTCEMCGKICTNKRRLLHHIYRHKEKANIPDGEKKCPKCHDLVKIEELKEHLCKTSFPCEVCGKIYHNTLSLGIHVRSKHGEESQIKYTCDHCGKQFDYKYKLKTHLENLNKPRPPLTPCSQCRKMVRNLQQHIKVIHTEDDQKAVQCHDCGKGFNYRTTLNKHRMNVHLKLRPHKCRYEGCDMSYNDTSNRDQHEKRTHGETFAKKMKTRVT